ncbi:helix-turn-helix domain-containing protein [Emticicia sp. 17c]|uniref:helix-turn-helix domain-containing protein n=1 Tax=Emticicia sp. 17c TaxID=3127704 RepID=UPI00301D4AC0
MLYLIGITITFFLAILLISKKNKSRADKILSVWLVFIGLHLQLFYLHFSGQYVQFPYLLGLEIPMPLVHGPFLYLYIHSHIPHSQRKSRWLLHFLPSLAAYISLIPFLVLSNEQKIFVYKHQGVGFESLTTFIFIAIVLSGIIYVALCWYLISRHKTRIQDSWQMAEKMNMKWIWYFLYGVAVIWIVVIIGNDTLTFGSVSVFVILIGYVGVKQGNVFSNYALSYGVSMPSDAFRMEQNCQYANQIAFEPKHITEKIKYQKSALKEEEALLIHTQLRQLMQTEKLFKIPELTLGKLAEKLGVHQNTLSQVINSFEQKTFYDYINHLRIEAFKEIVLADDSKKYTLLSLAFDCGFNSKTSFNRTFKKTLGMSPKEYLAQISLPLAA